MSGLRGNVYAYGLYTVIIIPQQYATALQQNAPVFQHCLSYPGLQIHNTMPCIIFVSLKYAFIFLKRVSFYFHIFNKSCNFLH